MTRHLISLADWSDAEVRDLLALSLERRRQMDAREAPPRTLAGRLQFNLFYENSTRTNLSFEVAGRTLGALVSVVPVAASSVHKGESLRDTVQTLSAQGADAIIVRSGERGAVSAARDAATDAGFGTAIVNAGEGAFGHPTQALLDAGALMHALGRTPDEGLSSLTVAICGDVRHSRVAASVVPLFARLGARLHVCAPDELLPDSRDLPPGVLLTTDRQEALESADAVMALRVQVERMQDDRYTGSADFHRDYGVTYEALAAAQPGALVMHPGPMNRGVEIAGDVADDQDRSLILSQVRQGVALRMALLETLLVR